MSPNPQQQQQKPAAWVYDMNLNPNSNDQQHLQPPEFDENVELFKKAEFRDGKFVEVNAEEYEKFAVYYINDLNKKTEEIVSKNYRPHRWRLCLATLDVNSLSNKDKCERIAQLAIDMQFKLSKRELQLVRVVRASSQLVAGMIYRLTFLAKELGKPEESIYEAKVILSFDGEKLLTFKKGSHGKLYW